MVVLSALFSPGPQPTVWYCSYEDPYSAWVFLVQFNFPGKWIDALHPIDSVCGLTIPEWDLDEKGRADGLMQGQATFKNVLDRPFVRHPRIKVIV